MPQLKISNGDRVLNLPTPTKIKLGLSEPVRSDKKADQIEVFEVIAPVITGVFNKSLFKQNNA